MSSRLLCRKKRRILAENRTQWTISGCFRMREEFSGENQRFMDAKRPDTASMLYRQIVMALGGPFANPLREDLDVHHIVQINPTPYPFS